MNFQQKLKKEHLHNNIQRKKCRILACKTAPDQPFDASEFSKAANKAKVLDIIIANKVLSRAKSSHMKLHYQRAEFSNASIITYNNSSFQNLKDGGSHGEFITYLVDEDGNCSSVMRQAKRLRDRRPISLFYCANSSELINFY